MYTRFEYTIENRRAYYIGMTDSVTAYKRIVDGLKGKGATNIVVTSGNNRQDLNYPVCA
jgi:hypothetical protein